ncbi:MAG: VWA domain-containing protein [Pedobacter sp.]|nr:VWA domain-containing protein [Pedobacter sp.]
MKSTVQSIQGKKPSMTLLAASLTLTLLVTACAHQEEGALATPPAKPQQMQNPPPLAEKEYKATIDKAKQEALARSRTDRVEADMLMAEEGLDAAAPAPLSKRAAGSVAGNMAYAPAAASIAADFYQPQPENREKYQSLSDNPVKLATQDALSTISLDVDTGSYSNVRRYLNQGQLPPKDAVRVEELVNYFPYAYPAAAGSHPFSVSSEVMRAPWNPDHLLLRVGVKAVETKVAAMPPANLVFLVDVSGSMDEPDKLPLVQASLKMLTDQLRPQDRVAMVVYAGRTAVELPSTPGNQKDKIRAAISRLTAGGSTAGEAAIRLAYEQARAGYIKGGINRILLATDGDFNVGVSDIEQIKDMVKRERESGISLTTLGFGQGNYQEALMEQIADVGNGNYGYIDSLAEARKVLVEELSSTFNTVAKDVKIQLEFNPAQVAEWRLVGYENRVLREEDFRNDKVDAGEVGAGKSVTALYEITPVGAATLHGERRYGKALTIPDVARGPELAFLRIRYKQPEAGRATELSQAINRPDASALARAASGDLRFASAVAAFGQLLRQSPYTGTFSYADVRALAQNAGSSDTLGYRQEFLKLVDMADTLTPKTPKTDAVAQGKSAGHVRDE